MSELVLTGWMVNLIHVCVVFVFGTGLFCFFLKREYIPQLVGLKLMLQSVSLGLVTSGWEKGDLKLSQSIVISSLIIEAVVIGLALTMIIRLTKHRMVEKDQHKEI
jgi:multisubunit Na+/H+ antiporter MnhC subunit